METKKLPIVPRSKRFSTLRAKFSEMPLKKEDDNEFDIGDLKNTILSLCDIIEDNDKKLELIENKTNCETNEIKSISKIKKLLSKRQFEDKSWYNYLPKTDDELMFLISYRKAVNEKNKNNSDEVCSKLLNCIGIEEKKSKVKKK